MALTPNSNLKPDYYKPWHNGCRLCLKETPLCDSHVIPASFFREISRPSKGKLLTFDDDPISAVSVSSKQWTEKLLCVDCEQFISKKYEKHAIELIRKSHKNSRNADGIALNVNNPDRFRLFFTSIVWRASVAKADAFQKVLFPDVVREKARLALLAEKPLAQHELTCRVKLLADQTGGFSPDHLRKILISPVPQIEKIPYSFLFVMEGLLLEFYCPGVKWKDQRTVLGFVNSSSKQFFPAIDIFVVPELKNLLVSAYGKHANDLYSDTARNFSAWSG